MESREIDLTEATELELAESRREVAERLTELKQAVRTELGWAPKVAAWTVPLVSAAAGVGLALMIGRKVRRRRAHRRLRD